jgi:hypothetical protein
MPKNRTSKNDNSEKKCVCSKCRHRSSAIVGKNHRRCSGKANGQLIPKGNNSKRIPVGNRGVWEKDEGIAK